MTTRVHHPNIIDFEASGFGPESYPIEVGVIKANGERYCTLIKPDECWQHWSEEAEDVHRISHDTLEEIGKPIRDVCFDLNEFLGDGDVFSDAWSHDHAWLMRMYDAANVHPTFQLRAIEFILNELQLGSWDETKERVFSSHDKVRHRASNDAFLIQQTIVQILAESTKMVDRQPKAAAK